MRASNSAVAMDIGASGSRAKHAATEPHGRRYPRHSRSNATTEYRVLIIEDEADIAHLIAVELEELPARTDVVGDGAAGLEAAISGHYDLVALDLRLPQLGGLEICRRLRQQGVNTPILIVSARGSESDRIVGLELGADDYMVKPFSPAELLARARALLRRSSMTTAESLTPAEISLGDVRIELPGRRVWVRDREILLTPKEFDLLVHMARQPGKVFAKKELLSAVWGVPYEGYEHTITCHINRLRSKLEADPQKPQRIVTIWGIGYKMAS